MLGLAEIEHLIKLGLYSAWIKNEKPVSIMVIAPVEHGKSELLKKFVLVSSVKLTTDFTTGIFEDMVGDLESGKIKTILIPDFLRLTKRKSSTQSNIMGILNSLVEEGYVGRLPLSRREIAKPLIANVITALTKEELEDKRHKWAKIGFLSRFIPISFSYKEATKDLIREYITDLKYRTDEPFQFNNFPEKPVEISFPKALAQDIKEINLKISKENNILGFRLQRQLQSLTMASALSNNRNLVMKEDVEIIKSLTKYINFSFPKV